MKKTIKYLGLFLVLGLSMLDIVSAATYTNYVNETLSCGGGLISNIPVGIPKLISIIYIVIQVTVPVVLVIVGSIDLTKAMTSQKEDEIKKAQNLLVKKLIAALIVFFAFAIVKTAISFVSNGTKNSAMSCAECFIKNNSSCRR